MPETKKRHHILKVRINLVQPKMALNEMEFLGNDRYFKYRYAQETTINVATVAESWQMESFVLWYNATEDYLKQSLNMKSIYEGHKVDSTNISKIITEPNFFNKANTIMMVMPRSFFDGQQERFSPSPVFYTARIIIVSAAPKKIMSTSMSFLNIDTPVVILIVLTLVLLSLLLAIHSIVNNKYKSVPTKKVVKKMAQETLKNVWENASLFCVEPIPVVLPNISCRLIASSWLIGVTFILFYLGCFLRTEFTTESYNYIDTLSDLIKSGIPPIMAKESGAFDYLKNLAAEDPVVKKWLDALDLEKLFCSTMDFYNLDGYLSILHGEKALISEDIFLTWIMGEFLTSDTDSKELLANNGGLYFSQHVIGFDYLHTIINASWLTSTPQVHENIQLSLVPLFETRVWMYLDFQFYYSLECIKWRRPLKSTSDLDLSSVFVPFYLLFMLLSGTVAVAITEKLFYGRIA